MSTNKHSIYRCNICNYVTVKKGNYTKHLNTLKHKLNNQNLINCKYINRDNKCSICGKQYKFRSGLSRHQILCDIKKNEKKKYI